MHDESNPFYSYQPIGTIHSAFTDVAGMPIQPNGARGVQGTIDLVPDFCEGLSDLDGFSRIFLLYALHRSSGYSLTVTPFLDPIPRGVFATRSPKRPNAIGLSIVRLTGIDKCKLSIEDVDVVDGTPLLDIKPYVPEFDAYPGERCGWLSAVAHKAKHTRSDDRFR
ncbi:tRNA (N6-threonylcarbamoyladenosine(37)-N6)-methyltransferase TrmO [Methanoregula sp.]|jgi:tRNA-Thr(GGU) m(6)t(6)A37 methyltransferase TsaA|uniref:tRNA (N6-threonylcarbamoyladenosine(37)-N6)-methyltransferase TrmO n=1 Tax=Methanoregula sp. TaxID=2052170 RepID=UPI003C71720F